LIKFPTVFASVERGPNEALHRVGLLLTRDENAHSIDVGDRLHRFVKQELPVSSV
jgi:hypothetical protein